VSFLSAVERGVSGVSIATLHKLSATYGTTVLELTSDGTPGGRLVRPGARQELPASSNGVRILQLALGQLQMEPQLFVIQPGAGSEGSYDHVGEEFIFVLRGLLDIWLDEQEHYSLQSGDCLYFPSSLPHRWCNPGTEEAELLWVNTPPTF
jgi:quercetin dioxygenase-like cupin family protein